MQVILRQFNGTIIRRCEPSDMISVMEINMKTLPEHFSDYFNDNLFFSYLLDNGRISYSFSKDNSSKNTDTIKKCLFIS